MLVGAALEGCGDEPKPATVEAPFGQRARAETPPPEAAHAHSARRCGECHQTAAETWAESAHARADRSAAYRAMREASGRDDCDRCHAPLHAIAAVDPIIASEGVTCDVCHTLRAVTPDPRGTLLQLELTRAVRYGPICDAEDHYFHRMGCSPLHARSELCGGCHLWTTHTSGMDELDVLSTYAEWRDGPHATEEQTCQACHMSGTRGEIAIGWGTRASVSDHGMLGADQDLRHYALDLELGVQSHGARLDLELVVTNAGAGHSLPTGLPARRLVTRVTTLGSRGEELEHQERVYGRILVGEDGAEVPFYAARRVEADTRLAPQKSRRERVSFASAGVVDVRVEVYAHAMSAAIARSLGVTPPEPIRLAEVSAHRDHRGHWEVRAP